MTGQKDAEAEAIAAVANLAREMEGGGGRKKVGGLVESSGKELQVVRPAASR